MTLIRQHQQIEILVRFNERVDDQQRVVRRHIVVHRAMRQKQMSLQVFRQALVCLVAIVGPAEQALIPFAPIVFLPDSEIPTLKKSG